MADWPDIPGITAQYGQPRLPRRPRVVATALQHAVGAANRGQPASRLTDAIVAERGADPVRCAGLVGWLPLSQMMSWSPDTGHLTAHSQTDLIDMAIRYAAWVSSTPVSDEWVNRRDAYARAVIDAARALPQATVAPGTLNRRVESGALSLETHGPSEETDPLNRLIESLQAAFLERGQHVRISLLALLAGQHVLLIGPPGTAKSLLARALCDAMGDVNYFEYLLSRFTHPDELFGPVSIPGLKEEDYRRLTEGYLPQAGVAFLDEVFKANSAILNSLLTLINERVFHHGRHRDPVPLIGLIGASNELPQDDSLSALYDRFLVRLSVPPLSQRSAFLAVATGTVRAPEQDASLRITLSQREQLRDKAADVAVPGPVQDALASLWRTARENEWDISDRRWRQAVDLLKMAAASSGRDTLIPLDLLLLETVLPPHPSEQAAVREVLTELLGQRSVPAHDLYAQWALLASDRVAPLHDDDDLLVGPSGTHWNAQRSRRHASAQRFLAHHEAAVDRLAADRAQLDAAAQAHPWIEALPQALLAAHIAAARELVDILEVAESYARGLHSTQALAAQLIDTLPARPERFFGTDLACALVLTDAAVHTGITLAGERVDVVDGAGEVPTIEATAEAFLDWVDGSQSTSSFAANAPSWAARSATTALDSVRRQLGRQAVPRPPSLPQRQRNLQ